MKDRFRPVPQSRLGRLAAFGQIAGGVATGMLGEGLRRLSQGERPHLSDLLLTPSNALKVTDQLSRMRGAAMKLGQMLSMDAGEILPAELTMILAQLRDTAHFMPAGQLQHSLNAAWGPGWRRHFLRFDNTPIAAASIGQVHRAVLTNGRELAVKVQYPGIASSIDADIDNAATLLRLSGVLPQGLDISRHLAAAKQQLHEEADYLREAEQIRRYAGLLADDPRFIIPSPVDELLRPTVLPMDFVPGTAIESLNTASEAERNAAMQALLDLVRRELFEFGLMQTDPNFANYRWQRETGRIVLLDFGATRAIAPEHAEMYRNLLKAGLSGDITAIRAALIATGFVSSAQFSRHGKALDAMIGLGVRHLRESREGVFDFANREIVMMMREQAAPLLADRNTWHLPVAETLFIQRKISGMALLCTKMRARVPLMDMLSGYC